MSQTMTLRWTPPCPCCPRDFARPLEQEAEALATSAFSLGHIAISVAPGYLDFRFAALSWRNGHPKLSAWHATFDARPSVRANLPVDDR